MKLEFSNQTQTISESQGSLFVFINLETSFHMITEAHIGELSIMYHKDIWIYMHARDIYIIQ